MMRRSIPAWIVALSCAAAACGDDAPASVDDADTEGGDTDGEMHDLDVFPGLSAPVEIAIDRRGIPHISGQTDTDVMFAAGYQMANDRLFQMDLMRRRALGRRAEVLGPDHVGGDQISRLFDFRRWGAANVDRLRDEAPDVHALVVAWLAGVNAYIDEVRTGAVPVPYGFGPDETGVLPEPWTLQEHAAIAKLLFFGNSNSLERELLATIVQRNFTDAWDKVELARPMFPVSTMPPSELPAAAPLPRGLAGQPAHARRPIAPRPPIDAAPEQIVAAFDRLRDAMAGFPRVGSNNWAVDGRHTDNGRPYLANDPHQPLESPSLMYAQHLDSASAGGTLDVIGFSFAGAAGIHLGHNRRIQWTATTNFADVMDIWEVELDGDRVRVGDQWVPIAARTETIAVAGEDARSYEVRDVPGYGVLLPDDLLPIPVAAPGHALLLGWTGFAATNEEQMFMRLASADSIAEFEDAVDLMEVGGFNFIAADATGISYRVQIQVPDRGDPSARQMPYVVVDGNDPGALWSGFLPPDKLPRSHAQSRGWIATANNDPWGFTFDGDVGNDPWYYGYFYAAGYRAKRIDDELTRLAAEGGIGRAQMHALQTDVHSGLADALVPVLAQAWSAVGKDETLATWEGREDLATLVQLVTEDWDRAMWRGSPAALAFHVWMHFAAQEAIGDELSILFPTILEMEPSFVLKLPALALTGVYPRSDDILASGRDFTVLRALDRTAAFLTSRFGGVESSRYEWGDMHGTALSNSFGGALDQGWVATHGGEDTVNVSSSTFFADAEVAERFDSHAGAIFRVVTGFADDGTPQAWASFPPGNSGDPSSPHFSDTLDAWVEGEYEPLPFSRAEIDAVTERTIVLQP